MVYTYDEIGNPTGDTLRSYTWEHGRQLASQTKGGVEWEYTYDTGGLRTKRSSDSKTYEYVYSGDKLVQMTITDHTTSPETVQFLEFSYDAAGQPLTMTQDGTLYYYVLNIQGDVTGLIDGYGNLLICYLYEGFGEGYYSADTSNQTAALASTHPLGYRGYVMDVGTGLYYLQSRYYDPTLGRFINADNYLVTGQGLLGNNMFAYCRNNPVHRKDVTGTADISTESFADDDNPLNDMGDTGGGGGGGYVYGVSFAAAQYSSLYTGGIYNTGYTSYGFTTGSVTSGQSTSSATSACFIAGTLEQTEVGTVPIEDVSEGTKVWAWDEETGDVALKEVVETYINETNELVHVFVNGEEIITAPTHPFYSPVKGWMEAIQLRAGDILVLVNGEHAVIERAQHEILQTPVIVYNFQVEDYHTYYVADSGVLVHNANCGNGNGPWLSVRESASAYNTTKNLSAQQYALYENVITKLAMGDTSGLHIHTSAGGLLSADIKGFGGGRGSGRVFFEVSDGVVDIISVSVDHKF